MFLEVENLQAGYGTEEVLHGVSLRVDEGEIVSILGANGAGKTTTLLTISGLVRASGGEQQMLAIGRALMGQPKLLLLDEPSLGLAPLLVKSIFETIRAINQSGVTILIVEQNARAALKLATRGYVLELGRVVMEDTAAHLLANPSIQEAYLGA